MASGDLEGAVKGLARSLERHELLGMEASPGCTPVLDPLRQLSSYRELMERYGMTCDAATTRLLTRSSPATARRPGIARAVLRR